MDLFVSLESAQILFTPIKDFQLVLNINKIQNRFCISSLLVFHHMTLSVPLGAGGCVEEDELFLEHSELPAAAVTLYSILLHHQQLVYRIQFFLVAA